MSQFATDWAKQGQRVGSGGFDKVYIWDLEDYQTSLSSHYQSSAKRELNSISNMDQNLQLNAKQELAGHAGPIEGVSFSPKDRDMLVSVGVDRAILGWDLRSHTKRSFQVLLLD